MTVREGAYGREIHLGVDLSGASSDFDSMVRLACTAERGLFDFVFLAEGLADTFAVLSALAAVTDRLGLVGAVDTTVNEPFEVARQLATLDHLSDGRAGWRVEDVDRDQRVEEFITVAHAFWDSWEPDAVLADASSGVYVDVDNIHPVDHRGPQFDVRGPATLPARPQGHPVLLAAKRNVQQLMVFPAVTFVGTAAQVAAEIDLQVQSDPCDGLVLTPPPTRDGLDQFVDSVVPLLQERGVFRTAYAGATLREHLRL